MSLSDAVLQTGTVDYFNITTIDDNSLYSVNTTNNDSIIVDDNNDSTTNTTTGSSYTNFILNLTLINNHNYNNYLINNNFNFYGDDFNSSPSLTFNSGNSLNSLSNSISTLNSTSSSILDYHFVTSAAANGTKFDYTKLQKEFIFDRIYVRIIFISLYSLVFCCCFFGNLLVILVVTLSRRLRSITNFFLANLAVADFCVGVFCVMQNLSIYLIPSWVFGEFLCKMYQFVHSLSYTASIFILVVICMERYFAIIHPIQCKQILTSKRLRLVIVGVWITSAIYSIPKFIFVRIIKNTFNDGSIELICISNRKLYNSKLFDLFNFGFLYLTPLLVMSILYSRIAIALWKSSRGLERNILMKNTSMNSTSTQSPATISKSIPFRMIVKYDCNNMECSSNQMSTVSPMPDKVYRGNTYMQRHGAQLAQISNSSQNVLRARRGVIRMLIVVVLIFALCNLPFHARKIWQYWSNDYQGDSNFNALFTPLTFLVTYFNSGVNPLLYAFLSRNFRKGMRELLLCSLKKNKNKSQNLRVPLQELRLIQRSHSSQCSDVVIIPVIEIK